MGKVARIRRSITDLITGKHLPFNLIVSPLWKEFLASLESDNTKHVPLAGNTARQWIKEDFKREKALIQQSLKTARSSIHLSFDLWTSTNHKAILGVVAHYLSAGYKSETTLFGLRELKGEHSGENQAECLGSLIDEYQIGGNLGCFTLDNAFSNDTCVKALVEKYLGDVPWKERRLRCVGHIMNLAVNQLLFKADTRKLKKKLSDLAAAFKNDGVDVDNPDEPYEIQEWRI